MRTKLPAAPTPLIGRDAELAHANVQLSRADVRLLTLTGAAGAGKTRLALAIASSLMTEYRQRVVFVDLATIFNSDLVSSAITEAVGARNGTGDSPARIEAFLAEERMLIVLDNFEHVLAARSVVAQLLTASRAIKFLVTSRIRLGLLWEHELPLSPLPVPVISERSSVGDLAKVPSVTLFVARARMVDAGFDLNMGNWRAVAEICVRLEGLPLAIELAAARIKLLSPDELLARLRKRFDLLGGEAPMAVPERHRTLRNAIAWSHALLTGRERALLRRLTVFSGGWTTDAAIAVSDPANSTSTTELELESLVNQSLVRIVREPDGTLRFRILETIREFVLTTLENPAELAETQRLHALHYLALVEIAEPELQGPRQMYWLTTLGREYDNLRAALRWATTGGDQEVGLRIVGLLWQFWWRRGHSQEARELVDLLLDGQPDVLPAKAHAGALVSAGLLALRRGDLDAAARRLSAACSLAQEQGDNRAAGYALIFRSRLARDSGDLERAIALAKEAIAVFRAGHDDWGLALSLHFHGMAILDHEVDVASRLFVESSAIFRKLGTNGDLAMPLRGQGLVAYKMGDYERARHLFEQSLALFTALGDEWSMAMLLQHVAYAVQRSGDAEAAINLFRRSLQAWRDMGIRAGIGQSLVGLASTFSMVMAHERAAVLFGAAEEIRSMSDDVREILERITIGTSLSDVRRAVGPAQWQRLLEAGRSLPYEEAIELALSDGPPIAAFLKDTDQYAPPLTSLTRREREVAALVARGFANRQIGGAMWITEGTANLHVKHILAKLGFRSRAQIAAWFVQLDRPRRVIQATAVAEGGHNLPVGVGSLPDPESRYSQANRPPRRRVTR